MLGGLLVIKVAHAIIFIYSTGTNKLIAFSQASLRVLHHEKKPISLYRTFIMIVDNDIY